MYAGWQETKDGCWVTQYNPVEPPRAIRPTSKGYELLEQTDIGWLRLCDSLPTVDDAMRAAANVRRFK